MTSPWPSVAVVIPTRNRPELMEQAVASAAQADYPGQVSIIVVYDGAEPDPSLASRHHTRDLTVLVNDHKPGLAGTRNTGILHADTDLVAFCDDDDVWQPGKLLAQVTALRTEPASEFVTCSITVDFNGHLSPRHAGTTRVTHAQLLRSRMAMLHSSTFLARRAALIHDIGLPDESIPRGQNEDWDLLLRAAARRPILHVDEPLVRVRWGASSHFARDWNSKIEGLQWMLDHHPAILTDDAGTARVYAQIAFAQASQGARPEARRWARKAFTRNPREWRTAAALAVSTGLVSEETILQALHRFGRGV